MRIGVSELIVVLIVALLVLGPDKLPRYARKLGAALAEFRKASDAATREIRENVVEPLEEAQKPLREAMEPLEEIDRAVKGNIKEVKTSLEHIAYRKGRAAQVRDNAGSVGGSASRRDAGKRGNGNGASRRDGRAVRKRACRGGVHMRLGTHELLLILLIVVIVFGPTQIPKLTRMMGKGVKQFKEGLDEEEREAEKGGADESE